MWSDKDRQAWKAKHPNYGREYHQKHKVKIRARVTLWKVAFKKEHGVAHSTLWRQHHVSLERKRERPRWRKSKYGISEVEYQHLLKKQKGLCAICGRGPGRGDLALCVDHDHKTKRIRGLLCHRCNVALGLLDEKPQRLRKALRYLLAYGYKGK